MSKEGDLEYLEWFLKIIPTQRNVLLCNHTISKILSGSYFANRFTGMTFHTTKLGFFTCTEVRGFGGVVAFIKELRSGTNLPAESHHWERNGGQERKNKFAEPFPSKEHINTLSKWSDYFPVQDVGRMIKTSTALINLGRGLSIPRTSLFELCSSTCLSNTWKIR